MLRALDRGDEAILQEKKSSWRNSFKARGYLVQECVMLQE